MADTKTSALAALTAPAGIDLLTIVDDPSGTPISKKITVLDLLVNAGWAVPMVQGAYVQSDFTLSAASGVQSAFPTTSDVLTLSASSTYRFRGQYIINTGATTHTTAMAFALGGGASVTSFEYFAWLWSAAANTIATTSSSTHVSGVASKVLNATSGAVYTLIRFEGIARINAGGTITPQINFSANPTGTNLMKVGSFIEFYYVGAGTITKTGSWA